MCLFAVFGEHLCTLLKMVEVEGKNSKAFSLARSIKPLRTRQPSPSSAKLPTTIGQLVTSIGKLPIGVEPSPSTPELEPESTRLSHDPPQTFTFERVRLEDSPPWICPLCLNLGNEVWDPDYRQKYRLGLYREHLEPAKRVVRSAEKGCKGCEVIAWILEPYMGQLEEQGGKVCLLFGGGLTSFHGELFRRNLTYSGSEPSNNQVDQLFVKKLPAEHGENAFSDAKGDSISRPIRSTFADIGRLSVPVAVYEVKRYDYQEYRLSSCCQESEGLVF